MIKKTKKKKTHDLEVASAEMMLKLNLIWRETMRCKYENEKSSKVS